jgi:hypothetical protein
MVSRTTELLSAVHFSGYQPRWLTRFWETPTTNCTPDWHISRLQLRHCNTNLRPYILQADKFSRRVTCTYENNLNFRTLPVSTGERRSRCTSKVKLWLHWIVVGLCWGEVIVGICAGGTVLKALIRATVDPLMSRCRQHIISLYSCNQLLSYATFSEYDVHIAVACSCRLQTMQGATSITSKTKSDYLIEFRTKQFTGCAWRVVSCVM